MEMWRKLPDLRSPRDQRHRALSLRANQDRCGPGDRKWKSRTACSELAAERLQIKARRHRHQGFFLFEVFIRIYRSCQKKKTSARGMLVDMATALATLTRLAGTSTAPTAHLPPAPRRADAEQ